MAANDPYQESLALNLSTPINKASPRCIDIYNNASDFNCTTGGYLYASWNPTNVRLDNIRIRYGIDDMNSTTVLAYITG